MSCSVAEPPMRWILYEAKTPCVSPAVIHVFIYDFYLTNIFRIYSHFVTAISVPKKKVKIQKGADAADAEQELKRLLFKQILLAFHYGLSLKF
jgi:hypothetical protein